MQNPKIFHGGPPIPTPKGGKNDGREGRREEWWGGEEDGEVGRWGEKGRDGEKGDRNLNPQRSRQIDAAGWGRRGEFRRKKREEDGQRHGSWRSIPLRKTDTVACVHSL